MEDRNQTSKKEFFNKLDNDPNVIELEKELNRLSSLYEQKFGHDIPYGAVLSDVIISDSKNLKDTKKRIEYLKENLLLWKKSSLSDSDLIGDTEIKDRLIPLIEIEIEYLELNNEQNIKEDPKNPFNTDEQNEIFKYLKDKWVYSKPIRYAYIFKFMVDELNHKIDFTTYNKFIESVYGKKVQRNNANREINYEQLRELMNEYKQ